MGMSNSRAFHADICDIVENLRDKYCADNSIDWYAMARDENILLYEPAPLIVPQYVVWQQEKEIRRYIFAPRFIFDDTRDTTLGHEYGHHFLRHLDERQRLFLNEKEAEADYFAEKLTGIKRNIDNKLVCESLVWIFGSPLRTWRAVTGNDRADIERCIREAES